jgi:hypothetical protein
MCRCWLVETFVESQKQLSSEYSPCNTHAYIGPLLEGRCCSNNPGESFPMTDPGPMEHIRGMGAVKMLALDLYLRTTGTFLGIVVSVLVVILDFSYYYLLEDGGLLSRSLTLRVRGKDSQGASRKICIPIAKLAIDSHRRLNMRNCRKPL